MASISVRNLDDDTKKRLRVRAAEHGRSLEAEIRDILDRTVRSPAQPEAKTGLDLFRGIREAVEKYGGAELEIPRRTPARSVDLFEPAVTFRGAPSKKKPRRQK